MNSEIEVILHKFFDPPNMEDENQSSKMEAKMEDWLECKIPPKWRNGERYGDMEYALEML